MKAQLHTLIIFTLIIGLLMLLGFHLKAGIADIPRSLYPIIALGLGLGWVLAKNLGRIGERLAKRTSLSSTTLGIIFLFSIPCCIGSLGLALKIDTNSTWYIPSCIMVILLGIFMCLLWGIHRRKEKMEKQGSQE